MAWLSWEVEALPVFVRAHGVGGEQWSTLPGPVFATPDPRLGAASSLRACVCTGARRAGVTACCPHPHRYFLNHGASVGVVNSEGEAPSDLAEEAAMKDLLLEQVKKQGTPRGRGARAAGRCPLQKPTCCQDRRGLHLSAQHSSPVTSIVCPLATPRRTATPVSATRRLYAHESDHVGVHGSHWCWSWVRCTVPSKEGTDTV